MIKGLVKFMMKWNGDDNMSNEFDLTLREMKEKYSDDESEFEVDDHEWVCMEFLRRKAPKMSYDDKIELCYAIVEAPEGQEKDEKISQAYKRLKSKYKDYQ